MPIRRPFGPPLTSAQNLAIIVPRCSHQLSITSAPHTLCKRFLLPPPPLQSCPHPFPASLSLQVARRRCMASLQPLSVSRCRCSRWQSPALAATAPPPNVATDARRRLLPPSAAAAARFQYCRPLLLPPASAMAAALYRCCRFCLCCLSLPEFSPGSAATAHAFSPFLLLILAPPPRNMCRFCCPLSLSRLSTVP